MISEFVREQQRYTQKDLCRIDMYPESWTHIYELG